MGYQFFEAMNQSKQNSNATGEQAIEKDINALFFYSQNKSTTDDVDKRIKQSMRNSSGKRKN
ncbi:MAG: hypothetical protein DRR16_03955 [Candidatus Parabeggiatoa sp. nov. 3]|nr:MAG: hypothetical protein DRR16_03955 [Gammaproteobacteria bacterium]